LKVRIDEQQRSESLRAIREQRFDPMMLLDQETVLRRASLNMTVRRSHLVEDTISSLLRVPQDHLGRRLMVTFQGEEAVDAGGVGREFFHLLMSQLFSPNYGMFTVVNGNYYWFRSMQSEELGAYTMLGTVVALAAYNQILLPIRFPLFLYKKLLGKPIRLNDLEEIEPDTVRGLKDLLQMKERGEDLATVMLTFTLVRDNFGTPQEIELVGGGANIEVTNDNVEEYVRECFEWHAHRSVRPQFEAFQRGLGRLFSEDRIRMFAPDELDLLFSGEEVLEWEELKNNARYLDGYRSKSRAVVLFWEVFYEMSNENKRKFLQFTTGSDRAPIGGLSNVVITIQKLADPSKLPVSHTCFSMLCLPDYRTKEEMRRKLLLALNETEGFGLR
jgi:hypothetical protein